MSTLSAMLYLGKYNEIQFLKCDQIKRTIMRNKIFLKWEKQCYVSVYVKAGGKNRGQHEGQDGYSIMW